MFVRGEGFFLLFYLIFFFYYFFIIFFLHKMLYAFACLSINYYILLLLKLSIGKNFNQKITKKCLFTDNVHTIFLIYKLVENTTYNTSIINTNNSTSVSYSNFTLVPNNSGNGIIGFYSNYTILMFWLITINSSNSLLITTLQSILTMCIDRSSRLMIALWLILITDSNGNSMLMITLLSSGSNSILAMEK